MKTYLFLSVFVALMHSYSAHDVEGAFAKEEIVPEIVKMAPKKLLYVSVFPSVCCVKFVLDDFYQLTLVSQVTYPNGIGVDLGNELTPTQVKDRPEVTWEAEMGKFYTLLMIDPDAPSRANQSIGEIRHWLVMNIPEYFIEQGDEIIEFIGSGPQKDTGIHRYIIMVFKQSDGKIEHDEPRTTKRLNHIF